jgi:hypothetical protein
MLHTDMSHYGYHRKHLLLNQFCQSHVVQMQAALAQNICHVSDTTRPAPVRLEAGSESSNQVAAYAIR